MAYEVWVVKPAQKSIDDLPAALQARVREKIFSLADNPRPHGVEKLTAQKRYRVRVGDYRIVFTVDDARQRVDVYLVEDRKEAYTKKNRRR